MSSENVSIIASDITLASSINSSNMSSTASDQVSSINLLVSKLGHELAEIRTRALDNLISKLENHVINEIDLVQHKQLFIKLFELFNFPHFNQHEIVLNLLFNLANHKSAAKNIQDISGLQFLNALLIDAKNDSLKSKIEKIINRLMHTLSIQKPTDTDSNQLDQSNTLQSSCSSITLTMNAKSANEEAYSINNKFQASDFNSITETSSNIFSLKNMSESNTSGASSFMNMMNMNPIRSEHLISNSLSSFRSTNIGTHRSNEINFESMTINSQDMSANTRNLVKNEPSIGKIMPNTSNHSTFNWLPLTSMDRQFHKTAENSLRSNDPKKIKNYCTFLQTIVFSDFPAEIFLQRSFILKILIDLIIRSSNSLEKDTTDDNFALNKSLLHCMHFYCIKLKKRVDYIKNPSTFCDKDFYSNNFETYSRSIFSSRVTPGNAPSKLQYQGENLMNTSIYSNHSTLSSIDSTISSVSSMHKLNMKQISSKSKPDHKKLSLSCLDHDAAIQELQVTIDTVISETNQDNFETDVKERAIIEKEENWPIFSFCIKYIDTLIESLSIVIAKNNQKLSNHIDTSLIPIICETINNLITILYETKNEWCNLNLNEVIMSLFKKLNFNFKYCHEKTDLIENGSSVNGSDKLQTFNRLSYIYLIITFYKFINLMNSSNETSLLMPAELSETIFLILNDICLLESFTGISCVLSTILNHIDPALSEVHSLSNEICLSIRNACTFLMNCNNMNQTNESLIKMAKKALVYMDYLKCKELPSSIIEFASKVIANNHNNEPEILSDIEYLVTSCMMSKTNEIRSETYATISRLVNSSLSVQIAVELNSRRYKKVKFLTLNKVFYQLVTFGIFDQNENVKYLSEDILLHLLQCELLVPEEFQSKLSQLITIYMPFIQCFASQTNPLGQCILRMSDDVLTPVLNETCNESERGMKLMLNSPVERLRCSLRYIFSKDKMLRKKGFQQTVGFLTKYHSHNSIESNDTFIAEIDKFNKKNQTAKMNSSFDLSDFYLKFSPDKFADMAVKLKRKGRIFSESAENSSNNVFQAENLVRIYNIFTSENVDLDVKQNAGEQLAIMLTTGDQRLQKVFINLDGINYCIRYLRQTILYKTELSKNYMFLSKAEKENLDRIQVSCITSVCQVFYWNREVRKLYLFDIEFYRLVFKALLVSYNLRINQTETFSSLITTCQEDLSAILFILLFNQISRLDFYYENIMNHQKSANKDHTSFNDKFDLSANLKKSLIVPFNMHDSQNKEQSELKQQEKQQWEAYELHYRLSSILKNKFGSGLNSGDCSIRNIEIKQILDKKFRLFWNFNWHGGSLLHACEDLLYNEHLIQNNPETASFNERLFLTQTDKFIIKTTNPYFLFKQFSDDLQKCSTHQDALTMLDFLQIILAIVDGDKTFNLGIDSPENDLNETLVDDLKFNSEFHSKRNLNHFFNYEKSSWHLALDRFVSVMPSMKSKSDQLLFSTSFQTIGKMLQFQAFVSENNRITFHESNDKTQQHLSVIPMKSDTDVELVDKWLSRMIHNPSSTLTQMFKQFLINYESDELRINSYIIPLCDFIRIYFERLHTFQPSIEAYFPSIELLEVCIEQIQSCEVEKFRNLNKLAILVYLISSLLRTEFIHARELDDEDSAKNRSLLVQLAKSLVQIINTFNIGRGGLSLSFMGNFITKSAHMSLLKLVKDSIIVSGNRENRLDIVKAVLCLKDQKNNLYGTSWLIPLMLHRESQIRSISFSLISLLINEPLARNVLLTNQIGIWSIAFNVLLNNNECSIVRSQACAFLINLTNCLSISINKGDNLEDSETGNISISSLQGLLNELNFYHQIAHVMTSFYPYDTYSLNELKQKNDSFESEISSICSPLLISSISQLLYNLTILTPDESILMTNNSGIINLLISYVKPINLLNKDMKNDADWKMNEEIIDMLLMICRYLNLCCDMDSNCIVMMFKNNTNLVYDMIECLNISAMNRDKLKPFLSLLFELFIKFLNYTEERSLLENFLLTFTQCWENISSYILSEILKQKKENFQSQSLVGFKKISDLYFNECESSDKLYENSLQFYSCFLSKLISLSEKSNKIAGLVENVSQVFDDKPTKSLGSELCERLIKEFDKIFLVETNHNTKLIVSNIMKALLSLSSTAKKIALNVGLVETLIEHLKYTHSKLNLRSLNTKGPLKENQCIIDLQLTLTILKHLMCNSLEIKEEVTKSGLIGVIHSFWCWALQDHNLLRVTLSSLCTLTANNKLAVSMIVQSNITAQTSSLSVLNSASGLSLLQSIIKTLQKSHLNSNKSLIILKYGFSLLTNCAQSSECKSIFWKSNLLQDFTTIDFLSNKANSSRSNFKKEILWLNFLVSLSFTAEGQQLIVKVDNLVSTIISFMESYNTNVELEVSYLSLLVLRNIAFNQTNKSKLIAHADYINSIVLQLRNKNESFHLLAVSTLDSLLYECQKAKVILKNANVLRYLVELNDWHVKPRQNTTRIKPIVNNLIRILND